MAQRIYLGAISPRNLRGGWGRDGGRRGDIPLYLARIPEFSGETNRARPHKGIFTVIRGRDDPPPPPPASLGSLPDQPSVKETRLAPRAL